MDAFDSPQGAELYNLEHTEHLREGLHEEKELGE